MRTVDHTQRRYALILMFALAAFWGIAQVVSFDNTLLHVLISIVISASATACIVADCRIHGHTPAHIVQGIVYFTWPFSSFLYLVSSRSWRGAGLWFLIAIGLFLVFLIATVPTMIVLESIGWIDVDDLP
jgi:hypothetical protein